MAILYFVSSFIISYWLFGLISHPESKARKKLPSIKLKIFQLSPNIQIHFKGRIIHIHHWITLTAVFVIAIIADQKLLDSVYTKGFLIGGIFQGMTFPDWRKIFVKKVP